MYRAHCELQLVLCIRAALHIVAACEQLCGPRVSQLARHMATTNRLLSTKHSAIMYDRRRM